MKKNLQKSSILLTQFKSISNFINDLNECFKMIRCPNCGQKYTAIIPTRRNIIFTKKQSSR